jgi:hypothetical protein
MEQGLVREMEMMEGRNSACRIYHAKEGKEFGHNIASVL